MIRTAIRASALAATVSPAAALVSETLRGRVEAVGDATGVDAGDPVTTRLTFDGSAELGGF